MRFCIQIEYDGTEYTGWQFQNNSKTIQGEIENSLNKIFNPKHKIRVIGAGRTDSGVHAKGQIAHFDCHQPVVPYRLKRSLNGILPVDIRIKEIKRVDDQFHARFSAIEREYAYYITSEPTALYRNFCWYITYKLNMNRMQQGTEQIKGRRDFKSFCKTIAGVKHYICDVKHAEWQHTQRFLVFRIRADRFLHGMVRAIVGTLLDIGRGKREPQELAKIFAAGNRSEASQAAPAKGLILEKIYY